MKEELNIAAILKEKPKGTKLWSDTFGYVHLLDWHSDFFDVKDTIHNLSWRFSSDGSLKDYKGSLSIYPAQYMRDWSKFAWKKGDVLVEEATGKFLFFYQFINDNYTAFSARYELGKDFRMKDDEDVIYNTKDCHVASEHDAQIACQKLHESLSPNDAFLKYIRKQPEFKDGDIVFIESPFIGMHTKSMMAILNKDIDDSCEFYLALCNKDYDGAVSLRTTPIVLNRMQAKVVRPATDSEKQQLFDALAKENKKWNPDTLQIEDLPKKCEFKPMDWCLMRFRHRVWNLCQFAFINKSLLDNPVAVGGNVYEECIPYNDQTKHLLGTTDEWKGGEGDE